MSSAGIPHLNFAIGTSITSLPAVFFFEFVVPHFASEFVIHCGNSSVERAMHFESRWAVLGNQNREWKSVASDFLKGWRTVLKFFDLLLGFRIITPAS